MKIGHKIAIVGLVAASAVGVIKYQNTGCPNAYPNSQLTPGVAATQDYQELNKIYPGGLTYSKFHRNVPSAEKNQVMAEYGVNSTGEIDHFIPLSIGGSNDIKNLWPENDNITCRGQNYGFKTKDKLEAYLARAVKSQVLSPKDAQECILKDWIKCYNKYINNLGSVSEVQE